MNSKARTTKAKASKTASKKRVGQPEPFQLLTNEELKKIGDYFSNRFEEDTEPIALMGAFFEYLVKVESLKPERMIGKMYGPNNLDDITFTVRQAMFNNSHAGNEAFYAFNETVLPTLREYVKA